MIVVRVEQWVHDNAEEAIPLGVVAIRDNGAVDGKDLHRYDVQLQANGKAKLGHLTHWKRRGWVRLVKLALEAVDGT